MFGGWTGASERSWLVDGPSPSTVLGPAQSKSRRLAAKACWAAWVRMADQWDRREALTAWRRMSGAALALVWASKRRKVVASWLPRPFTRVPYMRSCRCGQKTPNVSSILDCQKRLLSMIEGSHTCCAHVHANIGAWHGARLPLMVASLSVTFTSNHLARGQQTILPHSVPSLATATSHYCFQQAPTRLSMQCKNITGISFQSAFILSILVADGC